MIASHKHRYVFVQVTKTASTTMGELCASRVYGAYLRRWGYPEPV